MDIKHLDSEIMRLICMIGCLEDKGPLTDAKNIDSDKLEKDAIMKMLTDEDFAARNSAVHTIIMNCFKDWLTEQAATVQRAEMH